MKTFVSPIKKLINCREEMSSEFKKIRWQWNSYGNSSRILIRELVGTFRVKYITQMTYEFFKNFDQNSG